MTYWLELLFQISEHGTGVIVSQKYLLINCIVSIITSNPTSLIPDLLL